VLNGLLVRLLRPLGEVFDPLHCVRQRLSENVAAAKSAVNDENLQLLKIEFGLYSGYSDE
jgi:hypothetical protein